MSSFDNLWIEFDTLIVLLKYVFWKKDNFDKSQQTTTKAQARRVLKPISEVWRLAVVTTWLQMAQILGLVLVICDFMTANWNWRSHSSGDVMMYKEGCHGDFLESLWRCCHLWTTGNISVRMVPISSREPMKAYDVTYVPLTSRR